MQSQAIKADDFSYTEISPETAEEIRRTWNSRKDFCCNRNACKEPAFCEPVDPFRWACVSDTAHKPFTTKNPGEYFKTLEEIQAA